MQKGRPREEGVCHGMEGARACEGDLYHGMEGARTKQFVFTTAWKGHGPETEASPIVRKGRDPAKGWISHAMEGGRACEWGYLP